MTVTVSERPAIVVWGATVARLVTVTLDSGVIINQIILTNK